MKKITIIAFLFFIGCNLEVKVKPEGAKAQLGGIIYNPTFGVKDAIDYYPFELDSMKFVVVYTRHSYGYAGDGVSVINLTKDALEVKLLKKQLEALEVKPKEVKTKNEK